MTPSAKQSRNETHLWHPFADMAIVRESELVIERGEGIWVWDADGRRYLDATASLWYANVGHGRTEIGAAIAAQLAQLEAYSIFSDLANEPALAVAARLAEHAPMEGGRVFLGSGGADGVETAVKLARLYWDATGSSDRVGIVGRSHGYHGSHAAGTSIGGIEANRLGFGPLMTGASIVPHDSATALRDEIERVGGKNVAAFFVEPVIGAGGVYPPPDGYMEEVAAVCAETGVLLVIDATICGFGRLGTWFAAERWGIEPDMIVFAKGVTSGYLPLGGVIVSDRIAEPFWAKPGRMFRHGQTYAGHAACCAAAIANLDILEREGLIERGAALEQVLYDELLPLSDHPLVSEVRGGTGLMAAVELDGGLLEPEPGAPFEAYRAIREAGEVLVRPLARGFAISPPLTITEAEIGLIAQGAQAGLDHLLEHSDVAKHLRVSAAR